MSGTPTRVRLRPGPVALCAVLLCCWCGWASGFHRATTQAAVTWGCSLAAVVVVDLLLWRGRHGRRPGLRLEAAIEPWLQSVRRGRRMVVGVAPWLVLFVVVLAWEVLGIDTGRHQAHLTISALAEAFRPLNAAMLLAWMLVGLGYGVARARTPAAPGSSGAQRGAAHAGVMVSHVPATVPALLLPSNRALGVAFWLAVPAAGALVEVAARRSGGRLATAEELVRLVTAPLAGNVVVVLAWAYAGYHLFGN